jgi:hypothetical protein
VHRYAAIKETLGRCFLFLLSAQAITLSAKLLGILGTIVVPINALASKVAATEGYGMQIMPYDRLSSLQRFAALYCS